MARNAKKHYLFMEREDHWWCYKYGWVHDDEYTGKCNATNLRKFHSVNKMYKEFLKADFSCRISANYYKSKNKGKERGWIEKWFCEK